MTISDPDDNGKAKQTDFLKDEYKIIRHRMYSAPFLSTNKVC